MQVNTLTIRRPDDWHLHLRDGEIMQAVLPHSSSWCARAIIMPNLVPPVTSSALAAAYRQRILDVRQQGIISPPDGSVFNREHRPRRYPRWRTRRYHLT